MYKILLPLLLLAATAAAQPTHYTIANTHSHNDYRQATPFWLAYRAGFASIEADIYLTHGQLVVGHDTNEIKLHRTLETYYLQPLLSGMQEHHGYPYADTARTLQLLIELKNGPLETLDSLIALLRRYPQLIASPHVTVAITGKRPDPAAWTSYPSFIRFDGELDRDYSAAALSRINLMSDDFRSYSHWNGLDSLPAADRQRLQQAVAKSHRLGKPVRFWDAPDFPNAWDQLKGLGVDYINTDHIQQLADYLDRP